MYIWLQTWMVTDSGYAFLGTCFFLLSLAPWFQTGSFKDYIYPSGIEKTQINTEYNELCMKACSNAKWKWSCSVVSDSMRPYGLQPTRLLHPWGFPGKGAGVDCHFLLQGIFPTQESNPGLPHCRQMLYRLSHQGSPVMQRKDQIPSFGFRKFSLWW